MPRLLDRLANRLTLRTQWTLLAVAVCSVTVGLAAATSAWIAKREALELTRDRLDTLAGALADQLDNGMFERFREVQNLARLSLVRGRWSEEPLAVREVLEQLQNSLPNYAWIGFARLDGTVHAATQGMLEGASVAERPWFGEGLKGMTVQDVHPAKLLAEKLGPSDDGEPFRFVDVAAPVLSERGTVMGVLGAHLSWTWARDLSRQLLRPVDGKAAIELWVLASDGSVLLGPESDSPPFPPDLLARAADGGAAGLVDESGPEPVMTALAGTRGLAPYPGLGWTVVARQPMSTALASADRLFWSILTVGSLALLLGALFVWRTAARVTSPLRRIVETADRIGRDPSVRSLERIGGSLDAVVLSSTLRALLRRLGSAEAQATSAARERSVAEAEASREAKRLSDQLSAAQDLAARDPLTGLLNRRGFALYAEDAWKGYQRHRRPLAVLVIDIDHFKAINDRYGHATGDCVLSGLGAVVARTLRETDRVARFGGEEFVALLRETEQEGALTLAERLRHAVEDSVRAGSGTDADDVVTVSLGVAVADPDDRDLGDVIERADRALYAAKTGGRNRVAFEAGSAVEEEAAA